MNTKLISSRDDLATYFNELGFKTGAEIGVLEGDYSKILCMANPESKLYCVDSWGINERRHRDYHIKSHEKAKIKLAPYNAELIHKFSMDAVKDFVDNSLDFVYIDANHRMQFVKDDITEWTKKVRKGGIVSGHDYRGNIKIVVDEYTKNNNLDLGITTIETDNALSWWFVKN